MVHFTQPDALPFDKPTSDRSAGARTALFWNASMSDHVVVDRHGKITAPAALVAELHGPSTSGGSTAR